MQRLSALVFFLAFAILPGCSVKKNNIVSRSYHGMTTHYNYFFNARERMKLGAENLAVAHEDKYDRVLSIFEYGTLDQAKGVFGDMDEAIKKASKAIQYHSMPLDGKKDNEVKERNAWIDDCWLLIGRCQFYKHDYWSAIETFQYTASEYKDGGIRPEALLWLSRTYLELGKTVDAEYLLDFLKNDKEFPADLKGEYYATLAQYHRQKSDIPRAVENLELAVPRTKNKDTRARYAFILGQYYQKTDQTEKAFSAYNQVLKLRPDYEMAFNARINRARCYDVNSGEGEQVRKELRKMLKDPKNLEFQDQIYFALAGIELQEKKRTEGVELLQKSIDAHAGNKTQLAMSYLELGNLYLKDPDYIPAAAYYDSCMANLSPDHPDYEDLKARRGSLGRLVSNLIVIQREDSLLNLSTLTPEARAARVDRVILDEKLKREEEKLKKEEQQRLEEEKALTTKDLKSSSTTQSNSNQAGAWYFYNPQALSFGFNEFQKKWGGRKLEDHWRRSEKPFNDQAIQPEASTDSLIAAGANEDSLLAVMDAQRRAAYLENIPATPEKIAESNAKIAEAYYNVGVIYREEIGDYPASIESFETLDARYPDNKYKQPSYYNLYRTCGLVGDSVKANKYKDYLLTNYPESEYAQLILNPNFLREKQKKTAVLEVFYENTYRAYLNGQYEDVIERKTMSDSLFPPNKLNPKFAYLRALAIGKTQSRPQFETALQEVILKYPNDSVSQMAADMLAFMKRPPTTEPSTKVDEATGFDVYVFNPTRSHRFLLLYKKGAISESETKNRLQSFINQNFPEMPLKIVSGNIDLTWQYLLVEEFDDKDESMAFYETMSSTSGVIGEFEPGSVLYFTITRDNLTVLARSKKINEYSSFFTENYNP